MIGYAHLQMSFWDGHVRISVVVQDMRKIFHALRSYAVKNDAFPYDSRGSQYALYKMKPYLNGFPSSLPKECWDDDNKMLRAMPYDYFNVPNIDPYVDTTNPTNNIVIMAEKIKSGVKGINIVTLNGSMLWYQPLDIPIQEVGPVVGKYLTELKSPNWISGGYRSSEGAGVWVNIRSTNSSDGK